MGMRLSKDARAEAVQLYRAGWSKTAIARYFGVTRDTVCRVLRSAGLPTRAPRRGLASDADRSERAWVQIKQEVRALQRCPACLGRGTLEVQVRAEDNTLTVRCRDGDCQFAWTRPFLEPVLEDEPPRRRRGLFIR
jgi:transposase-like protein